MSSTSHAGRLERLEPFLPVLVPLVFVCFVAWSLISAGIASERARVRDSLVSRARGAAVNLALRFPGTFRILQSYAERFRFRDAIAARETEECRKHLMQLLQVEPDLDRVFLTDPSGVLFSDAPPDPAVLGKSFAHRDWYQGVSRQWKPYLSEPYIRAAEPRHHVIALAFPVVLNDRVIGVIVGQIRLPTLARYLAPFEPEHDGAVYLVGPDGTILVRTDESQQPRPSGALLDAILAAKPAVVEGEPFPGAAAVVAAVEPGDDGNWLVVVLQRADRAMEQARRISERTVGLAALLYVALAGLWQLQRRRNHELAEAAHALAVKNRDLEGLVSTVSHDLKAPLVSLGGIASMLSEEYGPSLPDEAAKYVGLIQLNADRMRTLIDDILKFSRVGMTDLPVTRVDTREVVDRVLGDLKPLLDRRGVQVALSGEFPVMTTSAVGLYQILSNLTGNAIKFLGDNPDPRIEIACAPAHEGHEFRVTDNGVGIDPEYHARIFKPFTRLQDVKTEGSGVGLAIVQRIIEKLDGKLTLASAKGQGSTFTVYLPG